MEDIIFVKGLKVASYKISGLSSVSLCLRIKAGSWYEEGSDWGKMHLLEHLMFQGTKKYPTSEKLEIFCEENIITSNASTSGSQIVVSLRCPVDSLQKCLEYLTEIVFHTTLEESAITKEKKIIAQEYSDKWSRVEQKFYRKVNQCIFKC